MSKTIVTGSRVVFADGDDGVHGRGRRDIWGWRGAMEAGLAGLGALWEAKSCGACRFPALRNKWECRRQ